MRKEEIFDIYSADGKLVAAIISKDICSAAQAARKHWPCKVIGEHMRSVEMMVSEHGVMSASVVNREAAKGSTLTVTSGFKDSLPG